MTDDKINAYMTLYTALVTVVKLAAPMIPFMTEDIYRNIVCSVDSKAPISVHLCDYPVCDESLIDKNLDKERDEVLEIVVLGRSARNAANIKTKQPVAKMMVKAPEALPEFCTEIIKDELNVKSGEFINALDGLVSYTVKPRFDSLRAKYTDKMGELIGIINKSDPEKIVAALEKDKKYTVNTKSAECDLTEEDFLIETKNAGGFEAASDSKVTVAIDTALTPELIEEGTVREIVSTLQKMRKNSGFEVMDRITVYQSANETIEKIMKKNEKDIAEVVLADGFVYSQNTDIQSECKINGEKTVLGIKKN